MQCSRRSRSAPTPPMARSAPPAPGIDRCSSPCTWAEARRPSSRPRRSPRSSASSGSASGSTPPLRSRSNRIPVRTNAETPRPSSRRASPASRSAPRRSIPPSCAAWGDVPGQTLEGWAATLDDAIGLGVDHVSAYALTLDDPDAEGLTGPLGDHLPTTAGARRWRQAAVADQDDDRAAGQYAQAVEGLAAAGFRGYEISNWGR